MLSRLAVAGLMGAMLTLAPCLALAQDNPNQTTPAEPAAAAAEPAAAQPAAPAEPAVEASKPEATAAAPAPEAAKPAKKEDVEEILVTGSRIRRMDLTTAAPVTVVDMSKMAESGKVSLGDILQNLPSQSNAINTSVNNGGDGATRISLRGLGAGRTLVLLNGRRFVPGGTGADDSVDLNSIPAAAIERIEVLKDGASAIYGSDAIGGVVNIITKKGWQGTEASAFAGMSQRGDGQTLDLNVTTGTAGDRSSFLFTAGYYTMSKAMAGDRDFSKVPRGFDATAMEEYNAGSGTTFPSRIVLSRSERGMALANPTNDPRINYYNQLMETCTEADRTACPGAYIYDGSMTGPLKWRPADISELQENGGDAYNFQPANYLVTPQQRISLFASGDVKLGSQAKAFFEASYVNRRSNQLLAAEPLMVDLEGVTVSADNLYNPFGRDISGVRRRLLEFSNRAYEQDLDTFRVVGGLEGTLNEAFGPLAGTYWDASVNYGRNSGTEVKGGNLRLNKLQDALGPSFIDSSGAARCGTPDNEIAGCVPLNLFGPVGSISPEMVKGLTYSGVLRGLNQMFGGQINASKELFQIKSECPVGIALGYELRGLSGERIPDPITVAGETSGNKGEITSGDYFVNEGYLELSMPIISDFPGIEDLEATAALRAFNYSNFGSDLTWKFGGRWKPVSDVTVRGTYSTAFRAPSISDLYYGNTDNFAPGRDPCAGDDAPDSCGAAARNGDDQTQLRSIIGGNPKLKPETAKIFTAGVVYEPRFVEGLSLTLDYYQVALSSVIGSIGEGVILSSCYPDETGATPQYCDLIERDPSTQRITKIWNQAQNVGEEETAGIDLAIHYVLPTSLGRFNFALDGTWLNYYNRTLADGTVIKGKGTFDLNESGMYGVYPDLRANLGVAWDLNGWGLGVNGRFIDSFKECGDVDGDMSGYGLCYENPQYSRKVDAYVAFDAFANYRFDTDYGKTNVGIGVSNLFDAQPSTIYNGFLAASDPTAYDFMGRYFFVRMEHSL